MPDPSGIGYFLLLLGVLVAVHEFGHFIVAKACGVKVLKFAIGFGPRLIGFTRGETEYKICILPLGGYVKMAGELPYEELSPEEAKRGFLAQPPWKRALIVAAGPAFNLIFPVIVFFFVYLGDYKALSSRVGSVEPGLPAAMAGIKAGDRITSVDGEPVKTFDELREVLKDRFDKEIVVNVERDSQVLAIKLKPMSGLEDNRIEKVKRGFIGIAAIAKPPVLGVPENSPAYAAGLRTFDRILSVNGKPVADEPELDSALTKATGELLLGVARFEAVAAPGITAHTPKLFTVKLPKQQGVEGAASIGAERADLYLSAVMPKGAADVAGLKVGDRLIALEGKPLTSAQTFALKLEEFDSKPFALSWRSGSEEKAGTLTQQKTQVKDELGNKLFVLDPGLGVGAIRVAENYKEDMTTVHMGPMEALRASLKIVPEFIRQTVLVVQKLFTGQISTDTIGGPVMMYQLAQKSSEQGFDSFLRLMALISINLGIMNLLPIPILDGFALLSALWEGVRRRPIPMRAREVANMVGLAMLVLLMVKVFWNDISKLVEKDSQQQEQRQ